MKNLLEIKKEMQEKIASYDILKNEKSSLLKNLTEALDLAYIGSLYQSDNQKGFLLAKEGFYATLGFIKEHDKNTSNNDDMIKGLYDLYIELSLNYHLVNKLVDEEKSGKIEVEYEDNKVIVKRVKEEKNKDIDELLLRKIEYSNTFSNYAKEIKGGRIRYFIQGRYCDYIYDELIDICREESKGVSKLKYKNFTYDDYVKVIAAMNFLSLFKLTGNVQNLALKRNGYEYHAEMSKDDFVGCIGLLTKLENEIISNVVDYLTIDLKKIDKKQCLLNIDGKIVYSPANIFHMFNTTVLDFSDFTYGDYNFVFK